MIKFLRKYYPELIVFGAIFAILMIDLNPDFSFMNKGADSIGYIYSAKYLYPSYHTSAPLYLLVSHVFLWLPFGTEAWRMGLVSVLGTVGACIFIYLTIKYYLKEKKNARFYSLLGVLIYGTSALVISQSTIVNTYAFTCFFITGAYYFAVTKHWKLMAVMTGLGLAVHLLGVMAFLIMLIFKDYRKNWKLLAITLSFVLLYLYVPLTNRPPYMWLPDPSHVSSIPGAIGDTMSVIAMLVGTISVWDLPKRILDTIILVGLSVGVVTVFPIIYYFKKMGKKMWWQPIFWFIMFPIVLFIGELDMNTFDYTMVAIPFLAIVGCVGLSMLVERYGIKARNFSFACLIIVIGLGAYNANYFDLGRSIDPNQSTAKIFREEFPKIPDGAIFMPNGAWNWEAVYLYNRESGKNIYPICIEILTGKSYQDKLIEDGIKLERNAGLDLSEQAVAVAKSIIKLNDNIYTTVYTDVYTFGAKVVEANHNTDLIPKLDEKIIQKNATNPDWKWKPYNPYEICTSELFLTDWNYVIMSRYNFRLFLVMFLVIYALMIFIPKLWKKKKVKVK